MLAVHAYPVVGRKKRCYAADDFHSYEPVTKHFECRRNVVETRISRADYVEERAVDAEWIEIVVLDAQRIRPYKEGHP